MTAGKGVVLTLVRRREGTKTAHVPIGWEGITTARKYLVAYRLMPHIPYNTVVGRIKDVVQGNRKLHHSKSAGEMTRIVGHSFYDFLTELAAYLRQFFDGHSPKVSRQLYLRQQLLRHFFHAFLLF